MSELSELYLKTIAKKAIAIDGRLRVLLKAVPEETNNLNAYPIVTCSICDVSMGRVSGTTVYSCFHCKSKVQVTVPSRI